MCSASSTIRSQVRLSAYLVIFVVLGACSSVIAFFMAIAGNRFDVNYVVARTFYFLIRNALNFSVELEGEEHLQHRPAILISNHQSVLDMFIVGRVMPKQTSIMSKKSIQFTPLGPFMTMSGAVFIDRSNPTRAVSSLNEAGEAMKVRKTSLWMYPEGTRSTTEVPSLLPFKKGAFHLAVQAGIPVIPLVTENTWRFFRKGFFGSGVIKVRVLPPIPTEGLTVDDINALSLRVREDMLKALIEISARVAAATEPEPEPEPKSRIEKVVDASPKVVLSEPTPAVPAAVAVPNPTQPEPTPPEPIALAENRQSQESLSGIHLSQDMSATSSENGTGTETEEDEGMVLVGRPPT